MYGIVGRKNEYYKEKLVIAIPAGLKCETRNSYYGL
jgi:hypothetical protein